MGAVGATGHYSSHKEPWLYQKDGNPLGKAFKAADIAEQVTRKLIPSTNEVFDRYWSGDIAKSAFGKDHGIFSKQFWDPKAGYKTKKQDPKCDWIEWDPKTKKYINHPPCK